MNVQTNTSLRMQLGQGRIVMAPGCYDGLSALLVEQAGFQGRVAAAAHALTEGLAAEARDARVEFSAQSIGSIFGIYFRATPPSRFAEVMQSDRERFKRFFHSMLARGMYLAPSAYEAGFVSAAHTGVEIDATLAAARGAFRELT